MAARCVCALVVVLSALMVPGSSDTGRAVAAADDRFGIVMVGNAEDGAGAEARAEQVLRALGVSWWYGYGLSATQVPGTQRVQMARPAMNVADVAAQAARFRGSYWMIGNEPNVPDQDDIGPEAFATWFHEVTGAIKQADPTAKLVGPNALNWEFTCGQCAGYPSGKSWTESFISAYQKAYGRVPEIDVWGMHAYDLDWANTPLTNSARTWEQLEGARRWLETQPAYRGKPIWLTEFGVIYGYEGFGVADGKVVPAGPWRQDKIDGYVQDMVQRLTSQGPALGVDKWFIFSALPVTEAWQKETSLSAMLKGKIDSLALSSEGRIYTGRTAPASSGGASTGSTDSGSTGNSGNTGSAGTTTVVQPPVVQPPVVPGGMSGAVTNQAGLVVAPALPSWLQVAVAPLAGVFEQFYAERQGLRVLGNTLSGLKVENGTSVQYFEKGRMEEHAQESNPAWQFQYGLLVDELMAAGALLPVGGDASSLTYASLLRLADAAARLPAPAGFSGGTQTLADGGTFVPFSASLQPEAGHVVPAYFWQYVNDESLFPGGWLHDIGLPVTEAVEAVVDKGADQGRRITVQAFQRTVLTYDPANPAGWQVERANVGTDYARWFPGRVQ